MAEGGFRLDLRITLLGSVAITGGGGAGRLAPGRESTFLAVLALRANTVVSTAELVEALWGEHGPKSAPNALQVYATRVRAALRSVCGGPGPVWSLDRIGQGYRLHLPDVAVDAHDAAQCLAKARAALLAGRCREAGTIARAGLDLWLGDPLTGVAQSAAIEREMAQLAHIYLNLIEVAADAALAMGDNDSVITWMQTETNHHPYQEALWHRWAVALFRAGRGADALAVISRVRNVLADELGIDLGPALAQLQAGILDNDPQLLLTPPEQPATATSTIKPLPSYVTRLVGRDTDADNLRELLADPNVRLVTLIGIGGVGKTRLGVEVARSWATTSGCEVAFVDGASIHATAFVEEMIRSVGGQVATGDTLATLAAALHGRDMLMVLDNMEHLVDTAAALLPHALRSTPGLRILATSRTLIDIAGEHRFPVPPLSPAAAADLFTARARESNRLFDITTDAHAQVALLCQHTDCLPLGIELIAAALRLQTLADLTARVERDSLDIQGRRTNSARQRTLRAIIASSFDTLAESQHDLAVRLSVFVGGFTADAAVDVSILPEYATLTALGDLLDASLITDEGTAIAGAGSRRFRMLETVRQYLRPRVELGIEAQRRHATYYLTHFTTGAASALDDPFGGQLNSELANVEAAITTLSGYDPAAATALIAATFRRFAITGRRSLAINWCPPVLASHDLDEQDRLALKCMYGQSAYHLDIGGTTEREQFIADVRAYLSSGATSYVAVVTSLRAITYLGDHHRFDEAQQLVDMATAAADQLETTHEQSMALSAARYIARRRGDVATSIQLGRRQLDIVRQDGDAIAVAGSLLGMVDSLIAANRMSDALELAQECAELAREHDVPYLKLYSCAAQGRALTAAGHYQQALDPLIDDLLICAANGDSPDDLGWLTIALFPFDQPTAATVWGATCALLNESGDDDLIPPPHVLGDIAKHLETHYPDAVADGRRGWRTIITAVLDSHAAMTDSTGKSPPSLET